MSGLAWLGRQGTRATAVLVFVCIAIPSIGTVLKPFVAEAVFVLLCMAFARVDTAALRVYLRRPTLLVAAALWTMVVIPAVFALTARAIGLEHRTPDLFLGVLLQAVASPLMAAPALAALMGFDTTLVLVTLVAGSALIPLTAPAFVASFAGAGLTLSPVALGLKLLAILGGSLVVAVIVRRLVGAVAIARHKAEIDGVNILVMFVFTAAVMEHVAARLLSTPWVMLGLIALAFAIFFLVFGLTTLVFWSNGRERALALGLVAAQRNLGLMVAATGAVPDLTWLYFAACQLPIYLAPQLLKRLAGSAACQAEITAHAARH